MTLRLAHRGAHGALPENSLEALVAATVVPGCDGVEFDVRFSADGQPIVLHDETLRRVQGRPERARDLTADGLGRAGVPRLADVLVALPAACFLDIELKEPPLETFAAVLLNGRGDRPSAVAISSFDPAILADLDPRLAAWPRWLNASGLGSVEIDAALRAGCSTVAVHWSAIDPAALDRARAAGLGVAAWTIRRRPTRDRLERLGLAAICVEGRALAP